ncbi:MAG: ATP-binding protein [Oscillospiraceae bacterium]|nr:ATP-binding protein [Oscillospiraceae bacterium]
MNYPNGQQMMGAPNPYQTGASPDEQQMMAYQNPYQTGASPNEQQMMAYQNPYQTGVNPTTVFQTINVVAKPPALKTKYKEDHGETLSIDKEANMMFNVSSNCLVKYDSITEEEAKDIALLGTVIQIKRFDLAEQYKDKCIYAVYCTPATNKNETRIVYVSEKEFGKAAMITKLKAEGGLATPGKQNDRKLANLIVDRFNVFTDKVETEYLPYFNGWNDDKYKYYVPMDCKPDIESPYLNNILLIDETINTDHALHTVFNTIKKNANANSLMLFILMNYGILYSVFSEKGYYIKRLINLSGADEITEKAAHFIKVFNKDDADFIGLNNKCSVIKEAVFYAKDMPVIFKGRPEDSKVQDLIDIYCNNMRPNINVNGKQVSVEAKSLCVVISNLMSEVVSSDIIWEFNIEEWNGNIDTPAFGVAVKYLIERAEKYVKDNKFHKIVERHFEQLPDDFGESTRQEIAVLSTIYEFLTESFMLYELDINELIPENHSSDFIKEFVLNANDTISEDIIMNNLRSLLVNNVLNNDTVKYTPGMTIDDESLILYDKTAIYMRYKTFKNMGQSNFPDSITTKRLLSILDDCGVLRSNNGNYMRLSVQTSDDKSDRSEWIGIKRSFFEPCPYILFPESDDVIDDTYAIHIADIAYTKKLLLPINNSAVANNHIGITGTSGMGKSNATLHLIWELSKRDIPIIIVDSANSLAKDMSSESFRNMAGDRLNIISVRNDRLKLSPFAKRSKNVKGNFVPETTFDTMLRGSNTLADAFDLNDTQKRYIQQITKPLIESGDASLKKICEKLETDTGNKQTAQACLNKLYTLMEADIFDESGEIFDWQNYLTNGSITYFSMEDISDESFKRAVGEFILSDIWIYTQQYGDKAKPVAVIFDEVSNFVISGNSALTKMLKEGRKYGIMCIWNTQSFCTKFNDEQRSTLSQAATMLFFDTAEPKEIEYISNRLPNKDEYFKCLSKPGECIAYGTFCDEKGHIYPKRCIFATIPLVKN